MSSFTPEQNEAIQRSGSNIIVSAGAGSGKTAVLSERVINKLKNGIHINELLILTFTNAAASEMKDRIRKKISKDSSLKHELELLTSSYITTFDSFALSVLKKYHYILNISNNIRVTDESIVKLEESKILDKIFDDLYLIQDENFINLINNYCVKNDKRLRENILKVANKICSIIDYNNYINNIRSNYFGDDNLNKIINDFDEFIKYKKNVIKLEIENLELYFDYDYVLKIKESIKSLLESSTNDLELFKSISLPNAPRGSSDEAKNAKGNLKKLLDELISYGKYGNYDQIKDSILNSKNDIITILDIVEKYIDRLNQYKKDNNIFTFNDIAALSIKILKENEFVRNELKNSFKEIMIDEYQDTNDIQDIFINLICDNNVYMVGDIKQSIYKFRGSNPNIFKDKYDKYSNNDGGIKIDLIKNFRSRSEVVNNINDIFDLLMDNIIGGANYKESHRMIYGNIDYDIERINTFKYDMDIFEYENDNKEYSNNEIEMFKIANDIKEKMTSGFKIFDKETKKLRNITYNDFVIILDRSKYFNDYKKVFEYMGIPLTILKDETLTVNTEVLLLKNLIDIVLRINNNDFNTMFKYDFISIARSFLYEYKDNDIFEIFKNNSFKKTNLYKELSSIDNINSMTSSMLFEKVLDITKFYEKINKVGNFEEVNVRINTLYNISSDLNELEYDISEFVNYLDSIIEKGIDINYSAYNSGSESVKIMTIHKSKGLEFPICYFADLDHDFNTSELKDEFIVSNNYGLIVPYENDKSVVKELYRFEMLKDEISEKLRLFYVALTRAREKIIIVLPYKDTRKMELDLNGVIDKIRRFNIMRLSEFIYYVKEYIPSYFEYINNDELRLTKEYLFKKKIDNKLETTSSDFEVSEINIDYEEMDNSHFSKEVNTIINREEYNMMKYGKKIHEILEYIDFNNYDLSFIKDDFIKNKISIILNNPIFKNINNAKVYKEYEFKYIKDNHEYNGIIDLMIEHDDCINIVDYKLKDIDEEKYVNQLKGYSDYIKNKTNKKVNLYLYSIINEELKCIEL